MRLPTALPFFVDDPRRVLDIDAPDRAVGAGGGVVVVGCPVGRRVRGPGGRSLAPHAAPRMAGHGIPAHRFELVPPPAPAPRILHSARGPHAWIHADGDDDAPAAGEPAAWIEAEVAAACIG